MFGLSWIKLGAMFGGWILAAGFGYAALHEYGVAQSQASRDQAQVAVVQASVTAKALAQQQAIDAKELAAAQQMRANAEHAATIARQTVAAALASAAKHQQTIRTVIRSEPPSACARQPVPAAILSQLNGG